MSPQQYNFDQLQDRFAQVYKALFDNDLADKAIIVIPSLTLDKKILSKVVGHCHYEERMLCMLLLLRMPHTHLTFVTSIPISTTIIDYYLHMLPGITNNHAFQRLNLIHCYDGSNIPLTKKILSRPKLIQRIKDKIPYGSTAHLICFNVTKHEIKLAEELQAPIYGCHPKLNYLGTKSGSRTLFRECGVPLLPGYENLHNEIEILQAIKSIAADPSPEKIVIKLNDGFSGDGNAILPLDIKKIFESDSDQQLKEYVQSHIQIVAKNLTYGRFLKKIKKMGGIIESFLAGEVIASPSVQVRINPLGDVSIISTHDQKLGGESNQVYEGAFFPASEEYAKDISVLAYKIGLRLRDLGVIGRLGIDFMSSKVNNQWQHYAIEINLRKGGTTHPFLMLQFLTDGTYDSENGTYISKNGQLKYYFATDNLQDDAYKGLTPVDLLDIIMNNGLHFDHSTHQGVMFHLISALSEFGKLGMVCIANSRSQAMEYYNNVIEVLNKEVGKTV